MSTLNIQLPRSVRECMENPAREEGMSLDACTVSVITRRAAVAEPDSYIRRRAARGSPQQLADLLAKAPDAPPLPGDELR
jgi:hypothetical protein